MTSHSKFAFAFLASVLAAGSASAARLSPDLQKQAIAMRTVACLAKAADANDDRVSDPDRIAARIAPLCEKDFAREEAAFSQGLSVSGKADYRRIMAGYRETLAAEIVVEERAAGPKRLASSY